MEAIQELVERKKSELIALETKAAQTAAAIDGKIAALAEEKAKVISGANIQAQRLIGAIDALEELLQEEPELAEFED